MKAPLLRSCLASTLLFSCLISCDEDEESKSMVSAEMRSTGISSLSYGLAKQPSGASLLASMYANSAITLTSYKIPIGRINLVTGLTSSGYTSASPNFYTCSKTTADECLVDLVTTSLDSLLSDAGETEVTTPEDVTYDGVAVEFCPEGAGGAGNSYNIKITGSVAIGSTTYYTNATSGLSATAPAEEVSISVGCTGQTTKLLTPVTLGPDKPVNIVMYADPNAAVIATTNKTLVNSNCAGEESLAICTSGAAVFATVDTATPKVERYLLDVSTTATSGLPFANMILTVLFDSGDAAIGASLNEVYPNAELERNMHSNMFILSDVTASTDGIITVGYFDSSSLITGVSRSATASNLTMSSLVDTTVTFSSTKL